MQKWEYCSIVGIGGGLHRTLGTGDPAILNFTTDGVQVLEIKGNESTLVAKAINQLGEQGWEMVAAGNIAPLYHCIYFKRPKP